MAFQKRVGESSVSKQDAVEKALVKLREEGGRFGLELGIQTVEVLQEGDKSKPWRVRVAAPLVDPNNWPPTGPPKPQNPMPRAFCA